jgi:hypothetical protein
MRYLRESRKMAVVARLIRGNPLTTNSRESR